MYMFYHITDMPFRKALVQSLNELKNILTFGNLLILPLCLEEIRRHALMPRIFSWTCSPLARACAMQA
jgi:hypothetical protein